jgi:hypothetical protein
MPEIIDPVFAKTSQNARFLLSENERFGLVFVKTGSINSGTGDLGSWNIYDKNTMISCRRMTWILLMDKWIHLANLPRAAVVSVLYFIKPR